MASNDHHSAPSIDSATTNTAQSDHSTPVVSDRVNDDAEKGKSPSVQQFPSEHDGTGPQGVNTDPTSEKTDTLAADPPTTPAPGPPPDGGFQAWMVTVGAFCGLFVSFGWINCEHLYTSHN